MSGRAGGGVPGPWGITREVRAASGQGLEAGLQAVEWTGRAWGASRFTDVDGKVDATINGIVVLVGWRGLAGVFGPPPGRIIVRVINEGDAWRGVIYPKLRVRHEVVYGCSGVRFFQAFIEGATECIHNSNLLCEKSKKGKGKKTWEMML